ncbi:MAG: SDR family oxidoreductase [Opitutales bacterium]|nr:SDR family oxidoreductase [Opitutales bacterium]
MKSLSNKKIAVIGGSAGMGLGIANLAAELGAEVIIGGRTEEKLKSAVEQIGNGCQGFQIDTSDEASVEAFFQRCGKLDHLATPGSSIRTGPFLETSLENLQFSINNKYVGQALCAKHALLEEGGSIVFFSGILAQRPRTSSLLGSINAAIECLAKGLAVELAPIRVNAVSPGLTQGTDAFLSMDEAARDAMFEAVKEKLPTGSVGSPDDMAHAAIFLMTSPFVTGHVLCVDGGGLVI